MLNPDFKEVLRLFNDKNNKYLVVVGFAMAAHGYPRYTGDIDLWVWSTQDYAGKILDTLREFGFGEVGFREEGFQKSQTVYRTRQP